MAPEYQELFKGIGIGLYMFFGALTLVMLWKRTSQNKRALEEDHQKFLTSIATPGPAELAFSEAMMRPKCVECGHSITEGHVNSIRFFNDKGTHHLCTHNCRMNHSLRLEVSLQSIRNQTVMQGSTKDLWEHLEND